MTHTSRNKFKRFAQTYMVYEPMTIWLEITAVFIILGAVF